MDLYETPKTKNKYEASKKDKKNILQNKNKER